MPLLACIHIVAPHSVSLLRLASLRCVASPICCHIIIPFILSISSFTMTLLPSLLPCLTILSQLATLPPRPLPLHSIPHPSGYRCTKPRFSPQVAFAEPYRAVFLTPHHPSMFANYYLVHFSQPPSVFYF